MKKLQVVFLFVFLVGCSTSREIPITETPVIVHISSPASTQTAIPPTQTLALTSTFTPAIKTTPIGGGAGKIAFTSEKNGVAEIYVVNSDGSNLVELANEISPKYSPAWAPDGAKIAFASNTDNTASLYVMNSDGSNPVKLIDTKELEYLSTLIGRFEPGCCSVDWSHDGKTLMFATRYHSGCCRMLGDFYTIKLDGSGLTINKVEWFQNWSPDGRKIAFESGNCGGARGICVMNADGTNIINLAHEIGYGGIDRSPVWSPDSKKIAFISGRNGDGEIFMINADGTNLINLTRYGAGWDGDPIWSPDGDEIFFSSYRDGNWEIYVMNADGNEQINLTNNPASDGSMVLSPDGTKIVFVSDRDRYTQIYMMDADGSNLFRVTDNKNIDYSPVWSP